MSARAVSLIPSFVLLGAALACLPAAAAEPPAPAPAAAPETGNGKRETGNRKPETATNLFPLVPGSVWVYASDAPQGDLTFSIHQTDRLNEQEHAVVVMSVTRVVDGVARPVEVQREWFRRTPEGDVVCPRRFAAMEDNPLDPPQVFLKGGLAPGATWTWEGRQEHGAAKIVCTVEAEETVKVPAGGFKALRVRVETEAGGRTAKAVRWFAPGVGRVKEEVEMDAGPKGTVKIKAELKSYRIGPVPGGE